MKLIRKLPILTAVMILLNGCGIRQGRTLAELTILLDSLKLVYAPDTRVAVWELEIDRAGGDLILKGEVDSRKAHAEILQQTRQRFSEIVTEIRLLPEEESDRLVHGLVRHSVAHMRSGPSHRAELISEASLGAPVRILKKKESWLFIQSPNHYLGWVEDQSIERLSREQLDRIKSTDKAVFTGQCGFSYSKPGGHAYPVSDLVPGSILPIRSRKNDFLEIEYPDGRSGWISEDEQLGFEDWTGRIPKGKALVSTALQYMGLPYLWGGTSSKGVDCSGYTSMIFLMNGVVLPRDANQQSVLGRIITTTYDSSALEAGDLLFFGQRGNESNSEKVTHVAMYIGESKFIHASGNSASVAVNSMDPANAGFLPDYESNFVRATRLWGEALADELATGRNPFYLELTGTTE